MQINPKITLARVERAVKRQMTSLANPGFCIACGATAKNCEPDAREYECAKCHAHAVYGAEELLMMMM